MGSGELFEADEALVALDFVVNLSDVDVSGVDDGELCFAGPAFELLVVQVDGGRVTLEAGLGGQLQVADVALEGQSLLVLDLDVRSQICK